jgi:hypothetical protein
MNSKFRALILASVALTAGALAINTAQAETASINVPFNFTAAGKSLPAGKYTVERVSFGNFLRLQSKASNQGVYLVVSPTDATSENLSLKFENQGDAHVLQSLQYGNLITPRQTKTKVREDVAPSDMVGQ